MRCSIDRLSISGPANSSAWPGAAADAEAAHQRQRDVLGGDAVAQRAGEGDAHRLRLLLRQALRREHVLDFARADAERQRAERAVRAGVAVAADDRRARAASGPARGRSRGRCPGGRCRSRRAARRTRRALSRSVSTCCARQRIGDRQMAVRRRRHVVIDRRERRDRGGAPCGRARRRPSNACGDVTSWTRWRSM